MSSFWRSFGGVGFTVCLFTVHRRARACENFAYFRTFVLFTCSPFTFSNRPAVARSHGSNYPYFKKAGKNLYAPPRHRSGKAFADLNEFKWGFNLGMASTGVSGLPMRQTLKPPPGLACAHDASCVFAVNRTVQTGSGNRAARLCSRPPPVPLRSGLPHPLECLIVFQCPNGHFGALCRTLPFLSQSQPQHSSLLCCAFKAATLVFPSSPMLVFVSLQPLVF